MKELSKLVRREIWEAYEHPQRYGRDNLGDPLEKFIASGSPYNRPYNMVPDHRAKKVLEEASKALHVPETMMFLDNDVAEAVDLIYRIFCNPLSDNVVALSPALPLYKHYAEINSVSCKTVALGENFGLIADNILRACNNNTKIIWICSPNYPSGNCIDNADVQYLLKRFQGLVVVDEQYIDFSIHKSIYKNIAQYPNLIVLRSFSHAWSSAALQLGMVLASPEIIKLLNIACRPYHVNMPAQEKALDMLKNKDSIDSWIRLINMEKVHVAEALSELSFCTKVYPSDANFLLARFSDAPAIERYLLKNSISVDNCDGLKYCDNCLRIIIGSREENRILLSALRQY